MTKKLKLVMATNNAGKLREARAIAGDRLDILSLEDIGYCKDIPETADTLEGNALIKVRAIKDACGLDCFADDTGLMVDALGGAPGVHTARYAGDECDPDANIDLMLKNLEGAEDRSARFRTCVALSLNGEEHLFEGKVEGKIATERSGSHGFGYDPIFIPEETGICFADMTDEAKNAISHRGRAVSAMIKWISSLCICIFSFIQLHAASTSDWMMFNTFDDYIDNVFDTPEKTYFLVKSQLYLATGTDNNEKIDFLFCLDKGSGEIRACNTQNFLSGSLIRTASYNARKNYLLIVYDDQTIDLLYDNGDVYTIHGLKNFNTSFTAKEVSSISFDPISDMAYLSTGFGFLAIDDKKHEVAYSGIYNTPIDGITRVSDKMLLLKDGKLYWNKADSRLSSLDDFKELNWLNGSNAMNIVSLSPTKCVVSKNVNGREEHYVLTFTEGRELPQVDSKGSFQGTNIVQNKDGLLITRKNQIIQMNRETGDCTTYPKMAEDYNAACGSWDTRDIFFAMPRKGFYSKHRSDDNSMTVTREAARPNAPAAFRSNSLMYTPRHGMLVNTHGIDHNFDSHNTSNPQLLSGWKNGEWTMYGIPYLDPENMNRIINPCGMAQDPDDPDVFYFGSVTSGLLRYNITDYSSVLHMTRSGNFPNAQGHVPVQPPYSSWSKTFFLLHPRFDSKGNLIVTHLNTEVEEDYKAEIWMWTPEQRRASTSPETFQPFIKLPLNVNSTVKSMLSIPSTYASNKDLITFFRFNKFMMPIVVYDHNGTPGETSDDRKVEIESFYDADGSVNFTYLYCAAEDPSTGLLWIGSDVGVFTLNPNDAFTEPGKVSRIKVSRNDGTSLADYLLEGSTVN
ncbi:MAG: RdgB/HAM1 family non-canonical purine NTP pyrophosphatase, partial [Muribaculaceae bacterium]|nr:RdgB/HAM1 family non-canonical purine NTP pyrophosphatase [Muribaculaceae bacterium]